MASMEWFRWHHGSVTDPKFQLISRKSGCSVAEVLGFWAMLLESASMNEVRGCIGNIDFESLDCALGLQDGKAQELHSLMVLRGLIDESTQSIHSWAKRQPMRERDDDKSTERVKAFREKQRQVTPSNASETPSNAEKRLEEIRGDKKREEGIPSSPAPETVTESEVIDDVKPEFSDNDEKPKNPAQWIAVFAEQHGVDVDHRSFHDRKKFWPLATAWTNAGVTVGQMRAACAKAHAEATESIAWLPAYADRVLATIQRAKVAPKTPNKQEAIEARNRAVADAWVAEMEAKTGANVETV